MQILSIHLKNIKSHRDTELNFSPGINVLSGPNGVGKSTIFEAIGYAMFGVDAQSFVGNVERFITIGAKRGEIAVVFQLADEERYRVSRTVGTPSKWLLAKEVGGEFEVEEHKDSQGDRGAPERVARPRQWPLARRTVRTGDRPFPERISRPVCHQATDQTPRQVRRDSRHRHLAQDLQRNQGARQHHQGEDRVAARAPSAPSRSRWPNCR